MDETYVVTVFVVLAELCDTFLTQPKYRPRLVPAEIMLVAVVAARSFLLPDLAAGGPLRKLPLDFPRIPRIMLSNARPSGQSANQGTGA